MKVKGWVDDQICVGSDVHEVALPGATRRSHWGSDDHEVPSLNTMGISTSRCLESDLGKVHPVRRMGLLTSVLGAAAGSWICHILKFMNV